jgi:malonyl CoA-acyl carrier protein transacylase
VSPSPRIQPQKDLAFCFPCQPLNSFAWDASAATGCAEVEAMFALASRRLEEPRLAPATRLQVLTYTSAAAYALLLMRRGVVPAICLPHSMGLYAALVAAGACEFEPMLQYVIDAGQAIHESSRRGDFDMASVFGIDAEQMEAICRGVEGAYIANYNSTGHTVVSGTQPAVEEVCRIALERDCYEARRLNTGVPLHTPLMEPASLILAARLDGFPVRAPQVRVLCPFRTLLLEEDDIIPALSQHISRPVRFEPMVKQISAAGVRVVLEVGYEKLLSKFIGWTDPELAARSVGSARSLEREIRRLARIIHEGTVNNPGLPDH